jgi:dihydroorotate dehydrogenase
MKKTLVLPDRPIAASGAMGPDGRGWTLIQRWCPLFWTLLVTLKTVTLEPREGFSFWRAVRYLPYLKACLNAMSLGNKGIVHLVEKIIPTIRDQVIISIWAQDPEEMRRLVERINRLYETNPERFARVIAFEINLSCPNVNEVLDISGILWEADRLLLPVIAKIGYHENTSVYIDPVITAAKEGWIQGISAINTMLWAELFPRQASPLRTRLGKDGGVSGRPIKSYGIRTVRTLRQALQEAGVSDDFPIIGGGGIEGGNQGMRDVVAYSQAGATHISLGTTINWNPVGAMYLLFLLWKEGLLLRARAN